MKKVGQYSLTVLGILLIVLWKTGYNPFAGSGDIGEITTFKKLKEYKKDKENDGKRIAVECYFRLGGNLKQHVFGSKDNDLIIKPDTMSDMYEFVPVPLKKDGKNSFYVPYEYTEKDAAYYDNEGKTYNYDAKLLVSFTLKRIKEAEPEKNPLTGEYSWKFEQVRIDPILKK